jgi:hypothetical protein
LINFLCTISQFILAGYRVYLQNSTKAQDHAVLKFSVKKWNQVHQGETSIPYYHLFGSNKSLKDRITINIQRLQRFSSR